MKNGTLWALIIIIVLGLLGWWWYSSMQSANEEPAMEDGSEVAGEDNMFMDGSKDGAAADAASAYTVRYTSSGFSPETLIVPIGTTVTFISQDGSEMWVGADEHPTHTQYDGTSKDEHCVGGAPSTTSFDQCGVSGTYSFTFTRAGSFDYHNHRESDHHGTIVVTE